MLTRPLPGPSRFPLTTRAGWTTPALLAAVAFVARLPTFLSSRPLSSDDGVYGASVVDMRHGLVPYRDVFSSQGPLHLPLLYVGDLLGLHTMNAPRVTPVLAGAVTSIAVWASARHLGATPRVAKLAGLLIATTGTMLWTTGQITGDGPAVALTALAVWAALCYRDNPRLRTAVLTGTLFGAALATKPIVVTAVVPLAAWLTRRRRPDHLGAAAAAGAGAWLASAFPWGLARVWQQSFAFHTGRGPHYPPLFQVGKLLSTLATRDAILVAAVALGWVAVLVPTERCRDRDESSRAETGHIAIWLGLVALELVFEKALFANHLAAIALPLALLVACRPPPQRWLVIALVVLVPWEVANQSDILWPQRITGVDAQIVTALRALPPGAEVIADEPGLVWRAGRSTPAQMNDTTDMRVLQGQLTTQIVVSAASSAKTCAAVIKPSGLGRELKGLRGGLRAVGYDLAHDYGHDRELWLKTRCSP